VYDQVKSKLKLETDRPVAVREAILNCRKGGSVFVLGVFTGFVDKFPLGALMNKGLTVRGAQQHGQRYVPMLLDRIAKGELSTSHLATHVLPLEEGAHGYQMFKEKTDGCVRAVFRP
jgi:threonine dehydrogenase-like Zn-dependent dehydrogenase